MAQKGTKKVFVGLSGGVDSALSAALLKEQGFDVTGVFIETWHPEFLPCTWKDDRREAMRAAAYLDIPFISLDLSKEYEMEVGRYFIDEYAQGRTPNPDVLCNRAIKFGGFARFARENGADYVATGHYAQIRSSNGRYQLVKGTDAAKDQSYFLWMLTPEDLAFTLFPVGHLQKSQVRVEAQKRGLPQATRKDSQGICFLGAIDLPEFLSRFIEIEPGSVLDESGRIIGEHKGAPVYTIGERHGFVVTDPQMRTDALYVHAVDVGKNTITVGPLSNVPHISSCKLSLANIQDEVLGQTLEGLLRYHGTPISCVLTKEGSVYRATFEKPVVVAEGQSLVLYKGDELVGGGIVER